MTNKGKKRDKERGKEERNITELRDYFESLQSIFLNAYKLGIQIYHCSFKENYGSDLKSSQKRT